MRGNKRALFYFICLPLCAYTSKHNTHRKRSHRYSQRQERQLRRDLPHHIEQSVQTIHSITTLIFPYTHFLLFPSRYTHNYSFIFNHYTIIVCPYVHGVCTDGRKTQGSSILTTTRSRIRNVSERSHPDSHSTFTRTHNTVERDKEEEKEGGKSANTLSMYI